MSTEIAVQSNTELSGPLRLIQVAVERGTSVEQLQQLMELQERAEANMARKAFFSAMAKFKENAPKINKNKHVRFETQKGITEYDHATLDHAVDLIGPALSAVGIRHRWDVKQEGLSVTVTCILSHELGHSEMTPLTAGHDNSGGKNSIQAIGSTVSYLERYTFLAAVGMAPAGMDDDGHKAEAKPGMSETDFIWHQEAIEAARSHDENKKAFTAAWNAAEAIQDRAAQGDFIKLRDKKKAELR